MNQKIDTKLGVVVIVIVAIVVGMLVWKYEENKSQLEIQKIEQVQLEEQEKYPAIFIQPNVTLEEIIKQAIFKKFPEWKMENYTITTTVETNKQNHAIGRFVYDNNRQGKYHNTAEGIWFAAKSNESWMLVTTSYVSYWGLCQDFEKFDFPTDMTPDCWDTERNILIDTLNPKVFYRNGFTKADKKEITQAFITYAKGLKEMGNFVPEDYFTKELYVRVNRNKENYLNGTMLIGGSRNMSAPYFLAVKSNGKWKVVFDGQDVPLCSIIEPYKFPHEIIDKCYDEINKKEKKNL